MYRTLDLLNSEIPPKPVLRIVIATVCASLLCALLSNIFTFFNLPPPQYYLSLSLPGMRQMYFWQIFTFLFIEDGGMGGINLGFLIGLLMNMAVLWFIGAPICELFGARSFYTLYFACGIVGGLLGLVGMYLMGAGGFLSGPAPSLLALLVIWAMLNPEAELLFF